VLTIDGHVNWEYERMVVRELIGRSKGNRKIVNRLFVKGEEGLSVQSEFWNSLLSKDNPKC